MSLKLIIYVPDQNNSQSKEISFEVNSRLQDFIDFEIPTFIDKISAKLISVNNETFYLNKLSTYKGIESMYTSMFVNSINNTGHVSDDYEFDLSAD